MKQAVIIIVLLFQMTGHAALFEVRKKVAAWKMDTMTTERLGISEAWLNWANALISRSTHTSVFLITSAAAAAVLRMQYPELQVIER